MPSGRILVEGGGGLFNGAGFDLILRAHGKLGNGLVAVEAVVIYDTVNVVHGCSP